MTMTKRSLCSALLTISGILVLLLLFVDSFCFDRAIVEGHFWSPTLAVEPLSVDFGDVSASDDVRQEIVVKNTGWSSLVLERVQPSCDSCIVVQSYSKEPIPPGKQAKIVFSLDVSQMQGSVETSFIIVSNAKPQEVAVVRVVANVLAE